MRDADQRGIHHGRMLEQHVLDFDAVNVLAAPDQHVLGAIDDVTEAIGIDAATSSVRSQPSTKSAQSPADCSSSPSPPSAPRTQSSPTSPAGGGREDSCRDVPARAERTLRFAGRSRGVENREVLPEPLESLGVDERHFRAGIAQPVFELCSGPPSVERRDDRTDERRRRTPQSIRADCA
jgi:hypothetical protein